MARQELAARAAARQAQPSAQATQQITPEMARQELAARQAARAMQQQPQAPQGGGQTVPTPAQQPSGNQLWQSQLSQVKADAANEQRLAANPVRSGKVAAASALNTAQGLLNLISKGVHYGSAGLIPEAKMNQDYNNVLGVGKPEKGDALLALAPLIAAPEAIPTQGLGALGKLGARVVEGEAYGEAAGADAGTGGQTAAAVELPNLALSAARGRYAIPARLLKGTATAAEREANAAAAGDLPVSIGQITQSPGANKLYENVLAEVPFSGVSGQQKKVAEGVQGAAEGLVNKATGTKESALDPNEQLKQSLVNAQKRAQAAKNDQYNMVDTLAQQQGHQLELPSFTSRAKEVQSMIAESPLLQANPKLKSFMNKVGVYGEGATAKAPQDLNSALTGQRSAAQAPSIRDANLAKNELYNAGETLAKSAVASDRYMGGIYKELSGKIAEDIKSSISEKGSPELQQAFQSANQEYRQNYARFLNKDIRKLLDKDKPADKFAKDIVKPGRANDSYSNINLVQSLLPPEERNLLPAAYLSKAIDENGNVDASKMGQIVKGLGPRQFNALFGSTGLKGGVQDYQRLMQMSGNARSQMANPKTGARAIPSILGGGAIGIGAHAAPLTSAAVIGSTIGASKILSNYMTNPKVREKLLSAMKKRESGGVYGIKESDAYSRIASTLPKVVSVQQAQEKRSQ
jgi:hypothetical protein